MRTNILAMSNWSKQVYMTEIFFLQIWIFSPPLLYLASIRLLYFLALPSQLRRMYSCRSNGMTTARVYSAKNFHSYPALRALPHELHWRAPLETTHLNSASFCSLPSLLQQHCDLTCLRWQNSDTHSPALYPLHLVPLFTPCTVKRQNFFCRYLFGSSDETTAALLAPTVQIRSLIAGNPHKYILHASARSELVKIKYTSNLIPQLRPMTDNVSNFHFVLQTWSVFAYYTPTFQPRKMNTSKNDAQPWSCIVFLNRLPVPQRHAFKTCSVMMSHSLLYSLLSVHYQHILQFHPSTRYT